MQVSSRLAIYALIELAEDPKRPISVNEIGEKYAVSAHHLAKVMHTLGRAGLVRSIRGVGGGYVFSGNARRTTLLDIVLLFETPFPALNAQPAGTQETGAERALSHVLEEIDDIARATLGAITLSTLLKQMSRHGNKGTEADRVLAAADG
ncbi:MAG: Rrf2 family transcriptional regulator [Pseudomonadota bacterium]